MRSREPELAEPHHELTRVAIDGFTRPLATNREAAHLPRETARVPRQNAQGADV